MIKLLSINVRIPGQFVRIFGQFVLFLRQPRTQPHAPAGPILARTYVLVNNTLEVPKRGRSYFLLTQTGDFAPISLFFLDKKEQMCYCCIEGHHPTRGCFSAVSETPRQPN